MSEKVARLLRAIGKARNDSEKFAALLLVTKTVEAGDLDEDERQKIFAAVGFAFPLRLVADRKSPDGRLFFGLGVSLLTTFCSSEKMKKSPELVKSLPHVFDFIDEACGDDEVASVATCTELAKLLCEEESQVARVLSHRPIPRLCTLFCKFPESAEIRDNVLSCLPPLLKQSPNAWSDNKHDLLSLLSNVAEDIHSLHSDRKFHLMQRVSALLQVFDKDQAAEYCECAWVETLTKSIGEVLRSRISQRQRDPTLILASNLTQCFWLKWLKFSAIEKSTVLFGRLTCIEIALIVNDSTRDKPLTDDSFSSHQMELLIACFSIVEAICSCISDFDQSENETLLSFDDIHNLKPSLAEAMTVVTSLTAQILETDKMQMLLPACVRVVASWLDVEHFAHSPPGVGAAPVFIRAVKRCLSTGDKNSTAQVMSPVFMIFAGIPKAVGALLEENMIDQLCSLLCDATSAISDDAFLHICQALMGLSIDADEHKELTAVMFGAKLEQMMNASLERHSNLSKQFTITTLTLMMWNQCEERSDEEELDTKFFQSVVSILHGVHATDGKTIFVADRWKKEWDNVDQLWPVMMNELATAIRRRRSLVRVVKLREFDRKIEDLLFAVSGKSRNAAPDADGFDVKSMYKSLRLCLLDPPAAPSLVIQPPAAAVRPPAAHRSLS